MYRSLLRQGFKLSSGWIAPAGLVLTMMPTKQSRCLMDDANNNQDDNNKQRPSFFDNSSSWKIPQPVLDAWSRTRESTSENDEPASTDKNDTTDKPEARRSTSSSSLATNLLYLVTGVGGDGQKKQAMNEIVSQARESVEQGDIHDTTSLDEVFRILNQNLDLIGNVVEKYIGDLDVTNLTPTALFYYFEYEDERKNPSWKNRAHRFCQGIDIDKVNILNDMLELSHLTYVDSVEDIRKGLKNSKKQLELVYANVKSSPGEPAHFIAIPMDQPSSGFAPLEVIIGVRGTKSLADAVTDALCETESYRGGLAHEYILKGGKYLFHKHQEFLQELCQKAGKSRIKLTLVGHSLGAGSASIAGIEFSETPNYEVNVFGFGCPAILSKNLAEKYHFITTVVNDNDCIPRMSAATVANALLSLTEFNWVPYAKRDVHHVLSELQRANPSVFTNDFVKQIKSTVEPLMDENLSPVVPQRPSQRLEPELFPPGRVIHLYRDGSGVSGCFVPNTFFTELDISRRMVTDHLIHDGYQEIFLQIMRQYKSDHHYRFDEQ